ncbi:folylpolyglutamate synthase/dihydrofolate synthase family protein [Halalkalibacter sp. APA_J-10(15)]|uniref:bifunctional folylpolyglutamate synthase/dihydrofolate synthase n=1 Tax=Halalkalibacter sp. APA_J-10(15) TaxID=2933805 RepID=UPI001FF12F8D|nr:folylpolyglutamate synthase/dihydrofolate synthase family protein [Halalkalibacter sp. APA_J-10(15)]MCK0473541.1 bifunctional folylpolyglutamate synthase/dihydrofolate synthase [Halalkalibacter sp. APA_J-10(15)]
MKTGEEAIKWIHRLLQFGVRPGLERMEWLLEKLDHPERNLQIVHVAGTNGKGSTVSFMRHVYEKAGYNVGTFTSPFIERFEERITMNGKPISEEDLVYCTNKVKAFVEELVTKTDDQPTEFEVITLIAFVYFAERVHTDLVLLEVGLGGRLDSTNVVKPLISVITSIGYDHMHVLGHTLEEIAAEKAGIIKKAGMIVSGVKQEEAKKVIKRIAKDKDAKYYELGEHFTVAMINSSPVDQQIQYSGKSQRDITIQLKGPHQRDNAAVAIQVIERLMDKGFPVGEQEIMDGMRSASWIGRFEVIQQNPTIILDGAHNQEGFRALAETLKQHYAGYTCYMVVAMTKEKDVTSLMKPFIHEQMHVTFTTFPFPRASSSEDLYEPFALMGRDVRAEDDWKKAILEREKDVDNNSLLIICGSLYFIAEVRKWLMER